MKYVRYIGPAQVRQITATEWRSVGINAETVQWGAFNGFAVPADAFTDDQIRKAIEVDPYLVITGDDEEFTPEPSQDPFKTGETAEAQRVDILDDESLAEAFTGNTEASTDDRMTPRDTSGGGTPA